MSNFYLRTLLLTCFFLPFAFTSQAQTATISDQTVSVNKHIPTGFGLFGIDISVSGGANKSSASLSLDGAWYVDTANGSARSNIGGYNSKFTVATSGSVPTGLSSAADYYLTLDDPSILDYTHQGNVLAVRVRLTYPGAVPDDTALYKINVNPPQPPIFNNANASINENTAANTYVTFGASSTTYLGATDPDGGTNGNSQITYSLVGSSSQFQVESINSGTNAGKFRIKSKVSNLNFETATNSYTLTVRATDRDGQTKDATITVNVADVNETPSISSNVTTRSWAENQTSGTVIQFSVTDPDNAVNSTNQSHTFSIVSQSGGSGSTPFTIDNSTGALTVANINHLDYEGMGGAKTVTVVVQVADNPGGSQTALTAQRTVYVSVTNVAESYGPGASSRSGFTVNNACNKLTLSMDLTLLNSNYTSSSHLLSQAQGCGYNTAGDIRYRIKRITKGVRDATWSAPNNVSETQVALEGVGGTTQQYQAIKLDYEDNSAFAGNAYAYQIVLKHNNGGDCGLPFGNSYIGPFFPGKPVAPEDVVASQGTSCDQITISWSNIADVADYDEIQIKREKKNGFTYDSEEDLVTLSGSNKTASSYTWSVPANRRGDIYRFNVYAVRTSGPTGCNSSDPGKSNDGWTIGKPVPPEKLTVDPINQCRNLEVEWTNPDLGYIETSGANNWLLYKYEGSASNRVFVDSVLGSREAIQVPNTDLGDLVNFEIRGRNQCGLGDFSDEFTIQFEPLVTKPANFNAVTHELVSQNTNVLRFTFNPQDTVPHKLFRDGQEIAEIPKGVSTYDYGDAVQCQFNQYTIGGVNGCGVGNVDTVVARIEPELVLNTFKATDGVYPDKIELTWEDIDYEDGYRVLKGNQLLMITDEDVSLFVDENSLPGTINTYRVQAINACKQSNVLSDIGFADPNGSISGQVATSNGSFVEDAIIEVTPIRGSALKFNGAEVTGQALNFAGTPSDYVDLGSANLSSANGITIEGWFKFDSHGGNTFATLSNGSGEKVIELINPANSKLVVNTWGCPQNTCLTTTQSGAGVIPIGQWVHLAVSVDNSGVISLYKDGQLVTQNNNGAPLANVTLSDNRLGTDASGSSTFKGDVDEFRVWEGARTTQEIFEYFDVELRGNSYPTLKRYLQINQSDGGGQVANLGTGTPNPANVTLNGSVILTNPSSVSPILGGGHVDAGSLTSSLLSDGSLSLSLWVKSLGGDIKNAYIFGGQASSGCEFTIGRGGALNVANFKGPNSNRISGTTPLNDGAWHNIVYAYNKGTQTMTIYIDGRMEIAANVGNIDFSNLDLVFGAQKNGNFPFKGMIDDISLWSYPLDSNYLKKFYNVGLGGDEDSLIAYWKMDEGADVLTFDRTSNNLHGELKDGGTNPPLVEWSANDRAPVKNMAYTDSSGNYFIQAINYGKNVNGTNFTITPTKIENGVAHSFNPQNVTRTLSFTTTKHDGVDFTDVSTMPVSGFVKYKGTKCFIEYKEAMLNGKSINPVAQTNSQGVWQIDAPFGIQKFSIRDPYVKPDTIELFVDKPISNLEFVSEEGYSISGKVSGNCGIAVGPANVVFENSTKCFKKTILTNPDGTYSLDSIPPFQNLKIEVIPFNQLISFDPVYVYHTRDTTINFTYREDLQVEVLIDTAFNITDNCGNVEKVLQQNNSASAEIGVYEIYPGGNKCYLDTAQLRIDNQISTPGVVVDTSFRNNSGKYKYNFLAGESNLGGTGNLQYKKKLEVTAIDSTGRQTVNNEYVIVEGVRKRASTFTTTAPDLMFFVLRDPPGDGSYSYLSKDSTFCSSVTLENTTSLGTDISLSPQAGAHATAGWIAEVNFEVAIGTEVGFSFGTEISLSASDNWCFTLAENVSTTDDEAVVGEEMDLYFGGALNYTFSKIDILTYDVDACDVDIETRVARNPEGLETAFFYTQKHIEEEVIPALEFLRDLPGTPPDTVQYWKDNIAGWKETIEENRRLKAAASLDKSVNVKPIDPNNYGIPFATVGSNFIGSLGSLLGLSSGPGPGKKYSNVSFGYGASFDSEQTYANESEFGLGLGLSIGASTKAEGEINIAGNGLDFEVGIEVSNSTTIGGGITSGGNRTVGYHLSDNDPGDFFSVNIKKDQKWLTPVFETVAGESSCPHEANTLAREGVQISATQNTIVNVPADQPAIFTIQLTNLSESEDDFSYSLGFTDGFQDGAKVSINGKPLAAGNGNFSYEVPGALSNNTVQLKVEVERALGVYEHTGIELTLGSECDGDISAATTLNAYWEEPCSEISIINPKDNWVLDNTMNDRLQVSFTDYDTSAATTVTDFELQFAPENGAWAKVGELNFKDDIYLSDSTTGKTPQFAIINYDVPSVLPDGKYKVRIKASCPATESVTDPVEGVISRDAPTVFGKPQPSDGVLDPGDDISISFNENIDCSKLNVESMALKGVLSGFDYNSINHGLAINGGTAHGLIPHDNAYNYGQTKDFTVELWVKAGVQSGDPAIVANKDWSNGRNKGWAISAYQGSRWRFNIGDGTDMMNVIGGIIGDNQWHHIAAAVDRDYGIVLYQDGIIVGIDTSNTILTINNIDNNMPIGVGQDATGSYQYNFTGYVDELRIWEEFKFQLNILQGRFRSYGFDEPELAGLWRFDQEGSSTTFIDRSRNQNFGTLYNGPTFNFNEKAPISMENIESLVNITWTCAGDKIVIEPVTPIKYLENSYFTATVFDAKDMHGNEMVTPHSWTFYVDQNLVEWENTNVAFNVKEDEELSFKEALINKSGSPEAYTLTEIPTWLDVSPLSGTIPAGFREDISFVVDSFVNPGVYNRAITANTDGGFEKLDITVNVLCPAPDWYVDPSMYQNSMSVTTELIIEGDTSKDVNDKIAAFVGDEVRGVASVQKIGNNQFMAFLTIYSDTVAGENINFRIWDASDCKMYPVTTPSITFAKDSVIGSIGSPFAVSTTGMLAQITDLQKGWNWLSLYVNADSTGAGIPINAALNSLSPSANAVIRSQTQTSQYYPVQRIWAGSLTDLDNEGMYKVYLDNEDQLFYPGYPVRALNTPITINAGWNYIGYPVQGNIFINTALSSLNNVVQTGDIIKSQYGYAEYIAGLGWFGSLKYLEPGVGYMLRSSGNGTLFYPSQASSRQRVMQNNEEIVADRDYREATQELAWTVTENKYANVLNLTAQVRDADENEIREERMVVAAFVGNECRGIAHPRQVEGKNLLFMTLYSDNPMNEEFRFEVYFESSREVKSLVERFTFAELSALGSIKTPTPLHLEGTEKEEVEETLLIDGNYLGQNEPNPFAEQTKITFKIAQDGETNLTIYNLQGQAVKTLVDRYLEAGEYTVMWNGTDSRNAQVNQGAYYYTLRSNEFIDSKKMIMVRLDD